MSQMFAVQGISQAVGALAGGRHKRTAPPDTIANMLAGGNCGENEAKADRLVQKSAGSLSCPPLPSTSLRPSAVRKAFCEYLSHKGSSAFITSADRRLQKHEGVKERFNANSNGIRLGAVPLELICQHL